MDHGLVDKFEVKMYQGYFDKHLHIDCIVYIVVTLQHLHLTKNISDSQKSKKFMYDKNTVDSTVFQKFKRK